MKKFIIIGTRKRDIDKDFFCVYNVFKQLYTDGDIIVSGGCKQGGDRFAEIIARRLNMTEENGQLIIHRPQPPIIKARFAWAKAMFDRNTVVADEVSEDDVVIACVVDPDDGIDQILKRKRGGTEDTLKKIAKRVGIKNIKIV